MKAHVTHVNIKQHKMSNLNTHKKPEDPIKYSYINDLDDGTYPCPIKPRSIICIYIKFCYIIFSLLYNLGCAQALDKAIDKDSCCVESAPPLAWSTHVAFLQHSHFHHFQKISSYFPEDFRKISSYSLEVFRKITSSFVYCIPSYI